MSLDILLVEDNKMVRELSADIIKSHGYNPVTFESAQSCIDYLSQLPIENYPLAYISDMRIPSELGTENEKGGPEKLFFFLKEKNQTEKFYFITGNKSPYDEGVIQRTGAIVYLKQTDTIRRILEDITKKEYKSKIS